MSLEKADAIVIRMVDFSESSRVVTFFSREFGKFAALAKGAKRIKGPFDAALDLLSECRVVFIRKSAGSLNLLTEARLVNRFRPETPDLHRVYSGYYVAELLLGLTEDFDPAPELYDLATSTLSSISSLSTHLPSVLVSFELLLLRQIGVLPNLFECAVCGEATDESRETGKAYSHWVTQGGLLCSHCRREEYSGTAVSAKTIRVLRQLSSEDSSQNPISDLDPVVALECHRFAVSAVTQVLGHKPSTLRYLPF